MSLFRPRSKTVRTAFGTTLPPMPWQCELELDDFVNLLTRAATAAWEIAVREAKEPAAREAQDRILREHSLYLRQGDILAAAVEGLKAALLDHPEAAVRADRLRMLHEALGAAAVIARHRLEDSAADKLHDDLQNRLRTAAARKGKSVDDQLRDEIILKVAEAHIGKNAYATATKALDRINQHLKLDRLETIEHDTAYRHIKKNWSRLAPSLSSRRKK